MVYKKNDKQSFSRKYFYYADNMTLNPKSFYVIFHQA
jgi:hypothetical protein